MKIDNLKVYGLENSFRVSHFPHTIIPEDCNGDYTSTIEKLGQAERGSGHDCFLKGIVVQMDLTCTIKMWTEMERYHFVDIVSSMSTMHSLHKMNMDFFSCPYVTDVIKKEIEELQFKYWATKSEEDFLKMVYSCPVGLNLTAGITTNYLQLKTIYYQRKNHRLPEWKEFCKMIEELPHMKDFLKLEEV